MCLSLYLGILWFYWERPLILQVYLILMRDSGTIEEGTMKVLQVHVIYMCLMILFLLTLTFVSTVEWLAVVPV